MIWTQEQVTQLRDLWTAGIPTAEIGRLLGITKNSVVGKSHRLDLDGRPSPIVRGGVKQTKPRCRPVPAVPRVTLPPMAPVIFRAPAPVAPKPEPAAAPARDRFTSHGRCTWLDGNTPRTFLQCSLPAVGHGSWCREHREIVFPGSARRDAARKEAA